MGITWADAYKVLAGHYERHCLKHEGIKNVGTSSRSHTVLMITCSRAVSQGLCVQLPALPFQGRFAILVGYDTKSLQGRGKYSCPSCAMQGYFGLWLLTNARGVNKPIQDSQLNLCIKSIISGNVIAEPWHGRNRIALAGSDSCWNSWVWDEVGGVVFGFPGIQGWDTQSKVDPARESQLQLCSPNERSRWGCPSCKASFQHPPWVDSHICFLLRRIVCDKVVFMSQHLL